MKFAKELFISNIYNPALPDANDRIVNPNLKGAMRTLALEKAQEFLKGKMIGPPMSSLTKSVDELKQLGYVGVYYKPDWKITAEEKAHIPTIDDQPQEVAE